MSTFAITDAAAVQDAINYALSNLGQGGGGTTDGNVLVVNTTTGVISQAGSTTVLSYLYQWINIRYSDSSDGSTNFSTSPTNRLYYGILNNSAEIPADVNNPAAYQWKLVSGGGFGTTKFLYYSTYGGRQIQFTATTTSPGTAFVEVQDNTAINLDFVTATATLPLVVLTTYQRSATTPSTPTGGTYDFDTLSFTPPSGWSASIPSGTDPFWSSQNTFQSPANGGTVGPLDVWTAPVKTGQDGVDGISTYLYNVFLQASSEPLTPTGGSYDFATATGTPPTGWTNSPESTTSDPIWVSTAQATADSPSGTWTGSSTWTAPVQYTGAGGAPGERGFIPMGYVVTPSNPITANSTTLSQWFQASRTAVTPPIGLGAVPITDDTAQFTQNGAPANTAVYTYNSATSTWTSAVGEVINGNVFVTGSVNSNKLNANDIYTLNIQSTNAVIGNINSNGFWMQANTGDARMAGNVYIGNNANIGNSLTIGNSVTIGGLTLNGALLANTVGSTAISANAVIAGKVANSAVTVGTIASNAVTAGTIATAAVTSGTIAANAVTAGTIATGAVTANTIAANAVTAGTIAANAVVAGSIAANAVVAGSIAANAVVATNIAANAVVAGSIAANAVTAGSIAANAVTANSIAVGAVTANAISANAITSTAISANAVIAGKIAAGAVTTGTLAANLVISNDIVSTSATIGVNSGTGYWMQNSTGNAYFGGNVNIGSNLNVSGLITAAALDANTVATTTMQPSSVSLGYGASGTNLVIVQSSPTAGQYYNTDMLINLTTTQNNQPVYIFSAGAPGLYFASNIPSGAVVYFEVALLRYNATLGYTFVSSLSYNIAGPQPAGSSFVFNPVFAGYTDLCPTPGVYTYSMALAWSISAGSPPTPSSMLIENRSLLLQTLKR